MKSNEQLPGKTLITIAIVTGIVEAGCAFFRFVLDLSASRDTKSTIGALTGNIRIHHGYIGALLLIIAWAFYQSSPKVARWLLILGAGLVLSDLIHHLLVLWPFTGDPELHFFYPNN